MSPRAAQHLRAAGQTLRNLASGALLIAGFIALCWLAGLVTIR